jgi:hypothetical protein
MTNQCDIHRFYIVHEPGLVPRVGIPLGDFDESVDDWIAGNPDAEVFIVTQHGDRPTCGSIDVQLASEYVQIREAMKDCEWPHEEESHDE